MVMTINTIEKNYSKIIQYSILYLKIIWEIYQYWENIQFYIVIFIYIY